jgi:hypothetical protein
MRDFLEKYSVAWLLAVAHGILKFLDVASAWLFAIESCRARPLLVRLTRAISRAFVASIPIAAVGTCAFSSKEPRRVTGFLVDAFRAHFDKAGCYGVDPIQGSNRGVDVVRAHKHETVFLFELDALNSSP